MDVKIQKKNKNVHSKANKKSKKKKNSHHKHRIFVGGIPINLREGN